MSEFRVGDEVEVFSLPGDSFAPGVDRYQPGDVFLITRIDDVLPCCGGNDKSGWIMMNRIRKLPPKDEQSEFTFEQLIQWCNRETA